MDLNQILNILREISHSLDFEIAIKLIYAIILTGIIGMQRENSFKPAGFRTHSLVGLSAAIVMICGKFLGDMYGGDPSRIPAQMLSGIGFIGAGTILRDGFNVKGLTTAASLLAVTCIGLSVGAGLYLASLIATILVFWILSYSHKVSGKFEHANAFSLKVEATETKNVVAELQKVIDKYGIELANIKVLEEEDDVTKKIISLKGTYKTEINKNKLLANISSIEKVIKVIEL